MTALMIRTGTLVCLVLFIAGCGGGDDLTDEEYFERLQEIGDGISEASESLFAAVGPLLTTPEDTATLAAFAAAADAFARVLSEASSEMDDLRPPADIAEAHSEFRASFSETRDRFAELAATADEAQSADELLPLLETAVGANGPSSACTTLTDLAAERGLALDLQCGAGGSRSADPSQRTEVAAPVLMRPGPPPALAIVGGELRNGDGERVVLRGVAVRGVEIDDQAFVGTRLEQKRYSRADIQELAQHWGVNIIRVPIQPPAWAGDPEYSERNLDALVQWGAELGIYIFLGWHAHGNPITGEVEQPRQGPVPNERNHYNPDLELAKEALGELAERYRDSPWVLYGVFNEPSYITWREWRPIAEELVDVIHEVHPDALVFVSGVDWGYDLSGAIDDPVERPNVIYETHPYPGKGDGWKTVLDKLMKVAPVFIGEWGFTPGSSEENLRGTTEGYGQPLVGFAAERDIGWTAWWWHPAGDVSLLASWENYQPTALGQLVMDSLVGGVEVP